MTPDNKPIPSPGKAEPTTEQTIIVDAPKLLGAFRLTRLLGRGGMGEVWEAFDTTLERHVAVKLMRKELLTNDEATRRFGREARAVARLNHPNIVQVYTFGDDQGILYFVMELVEGDTITAKMKDSGVLGLQEAVSVVHQSIEGLSYAYARGIIHRDIKPSNLMYTPEYRIKIADFGLAKMVEQDTQVTAAGTTMGSPNYMSPEQARGEEADHRSDIYALGISFYQMLTGELPFNSTSPLTVLLKQIQDPLPEPAALQQMADGRVLSVIKKMTEKKPEQRYQSYDGLAAAVASLLPDQRFSGGHGATISFRPPGTDKDSTDAAPLVVPIGSLDATKSHSPASGLEALSPPLPPPPPVAADRVFIQPITGPTVASKGRRWWWLAGGGIAAAVAATGVFLWINYPEKPRELAITDPTPTAIAPPATPALALPTLIPTAAPANEQGPNQSGPGWNGTGPRPVRNPGQDPRRGINPQMSPAAHRPGPFQPAKASPPPALVSANEIVLGAAGSPPGSSIPVYSLNGQEIANLPVGSRLPLLRSEVIDGKTQFVVQHEGAPARVDFRQARMLRNDSLSNNDTPIAGNSVQTLVLGTRGAPKDELVPTFLDERGLTQFRTFKAGTEVQKVGESVTMTKIALPGGKEVFVYKKMAHPK